MGHKKVCISCRLALNRAFDSGSEQAYPCPSCAKPMILLPHAFRPPKKTEDEKWETVEFLIHHGFYYQHICETSDSHNETSRVQTYAKYPENLRDAKEFVDRYKKQALKK